MKRILIIITLSFFFLSGSFSQELDSSGIIVLGVAQDGGYPHLGCEKECCNYAWEHPEAKRLITSLALIVPDKESWYLFEATPDIKEQLRLFRQITGGRYNYLPDGVFITHAHIGHYTGLMEFGREVLNSSGIPVYVMPGMKKFLESNGPWSQLTDLKNIVVKSVNMGETLKLPGKVSVNFFLVPHRDEYSETAGLSIIIPDKRYLFIPDIDKWGEWDQNIIEKVREADYAFIDGTFFNSDELPGRDMSSIPHPFIIETISLFEGEDVKTKKSIQFIHLNHSNPLLRDYSNSILTRSGMNLALQGRYY